MRRICSPTTEKRTARSPKHPWPPYPPLRRPSRRFARCAAREERAALTDASTTGVPSQEEHICSSVLKRTGVPRPCVQQPLQGHAESSEEVDTIPKPVGLRKALITSASDRVRTRSNIVRLSPNRVRSRSTSTDSTSLDSGAVDLTSPGKEGGSGVAICFRCAAPRPLQHT